MEKKKYRRAISRAHVRSHVRGVQDSRKHQQGQVFAADSRATRPRPSNNISTKANNRTTPICAHLYIPSNKPFNCRYLNIHALHLRQTKPPPDWKKHLAMRPFHEKYPRVYTHPFTSLHRQTRPHHPPIHPRQRSSHIPPPSYLSSCLSYPLRHQTPPYSSSRKKP